MVLLHVYKKLLSLYPKSYQDDYSQEMVLMLTDMLDDCLDKRQRANVWFHAFAELPVNAVKLNLNILEEAYMTNTPMYMKRNTRLSGALILPFILLITLNELRPTFLPTTRDWVHLYQVIAFALPFVALVLSVVTISYWALTRRRKQGISLHSSLKDIRHNWSIAAAGSLALFILLFMIGHDSVHCITGNPIKVIHNPSATLQCIGRD